MSKFNVDKVLLVTRIGLENASEDQRKQFFDGVQGMREEMGYVDESATADELVEAYGLKLINEMIEDASNEEWLTYGEAASVTGISKSTITRRAEDGTIRRITRDGTHYVLKHEAAAIELKRPATFVGRRKRPRANNAEVARRKQRFIEIISDGQKHIIADVCKTLVKECSYGINDDAEGTAHKMIMKMIDQGKAAWENNGGSNINPGKYDYVFIPRQEAIFEPKQRSFSFLTSK